MNNKLLGTQFERDFCKTLAVRGWWVHFIAPAANGCQPFDVIAVKNGVPAVFDCKTSVKNVFPFSRLEDNQIMAFEKWLACGNPEPKIAVKYNDNVYLIEYRRLKELGKIDLSKEIPLA